MRWLMTGVLGAAMAFAAPVHAQTEGTEPTDATVAAPQTTPTAPTHTPKVAIVIAGDPDAATVAATQALEAQLTAEPRVTMPSDAAVRAALRGEGSGDGLDEVRAERRRLGLGEARDVTVLTVLGELTGADLVLVVRASHGAVHATAFDVLRRSFYDGEVALASLDTATTEFVVRRATRAARPLDTGETTNPPPQESTAPVVDPRTAVPPEAIAADPAQPPHERDFFEQYWPYFAAGALAIGAVIFVVIALTSSSSTPAPVLRFEVGGGS